MSKRTPEVRRVRADSPKGKNEGRRPKRFDQITSPSENAQVHSSFTVTGTCPTGTSPMGPSGVAILKSDPGVTYTGTLQQPWSYGSWTIDFDTKGHTGNYAVVIWGCPTTLAVSITVV